MRFTYKRLYSGLLVGALAAFGGFAGYAHGDGMPNGNRLSITGSPEELGQRASELGEHICATIEADTDCPVKPISDKAIKELGAMQEAYSLGQRRLHESLTAANFDRAAYERIETEQAKGVQASTMRYMQFLGEAAATLTPEQRQMFSHKVHTGH